MEKYAVISDDVLSGQKEAGEAIQKKKCPDCASALRPTEETGVLLCPACGSKPFEK
jgi:predicted RNA-binding Zn-ribbon protein involved in translation (DUF1610 family)